MTATAKTKMQQLEVILLFVSLFLPPFAFVLDVLLTETDYKVPVLLHSISTVLAFCSILVFLPVAIFNSFRKLCEESDGFVREAFAGRLSFLLFLFASLVVAAFYIKLPLSVEELSTNDHTLASRIIFLIYASLLIHFFFVNLNKVSYWLKERLPFLIAFNLFLFIFSWVFWSIGFGYLDERMWQERYDGMERWEGISELANDIRDFNLLERHLERVFPKNVGLKVPENSILLRSVPLEDKSEDKKVRIYFLDDRGFEMVEAFYTYKGGEVWEFIQASNIKLLKVD